MYIRFTVRSKLWNRKIKDEFVLNLFEELKKEIQTYVKTRTAPYKYPRIIVFRDELPKTISGKVRRVEIRAKDMEKSKN